MPRRVDGDAAIMMFFCTPKKISHLLISDANGEVPMLEDIHGMIARYPFAESCFASSIYDRGDIREGAAPVYKTRGADGSRVRAGID
jgi:hypothetical protein